MKFLADENIDQEIVERLRNDGHEVVAISEMERGVSDDQVFAKASQEFLVLVTADKDFGEIVFRQKKVSHGVILLRISGLSAMKKADIAGKAIMKHQGELLNNFSVISPASVRIRSAVRLPERNR